MAGTIPGSPLQTPEAPRAILKHGIAANIAKLPETRAAVHQLTRDHVRHRGIRNHRVVGLVSDHHSGGYNADSKDQK